ncbi:hypothetical protein QYF36_025076 [Acer negundo]|nr:hypothetical protein QYF36_025076 [Acer negundo]
MGRGETDGLLKRDLVIKEMEVDTGKQKGDFARIEIKGGPNGNGQGGQSCGMEAEHDVVMEVDSDCQGLKFTKSLGFTWLQFTWCNKREGAKMVQE